MRTIILSQAEQITHSLEVNKKVTIDSTIDGIVFAGMGGSGHPGDLLQILNLPTVPLTVHRSYSLPEIRHDNPLVIVSSYSGNTEEALTAYHAAREAGYHLLVNTAGGKLMDLSKKDALPLAKIDYPGMQPRHTLLASFTGVYAALVQSHVAQDITDELTRIATNLPAIIPLMEKPAQKLAEDLHDKVPIFTASENLGFAAKNFKIQTNENAKYPGFWNTFPELNHNEFIGFSQIKNTKHPNKYQVVILRDPADHPRIRARMDITAEMYQAWGVTVSQIEVKGDSLLEKIIYAVIFGLWTTMFLAESYGLDPIPVAGVEGFKKKLEEVAGKID